MGLKTADMKVNDVVKFCAISRLFHSCRDGPMLGIIHTCTALRYKPAFIATL